MRPSRFPNRRLALLALAGIAATPPGSLAQTNAGFPAKPVKFIVAFPPGGPLDLLARSMADVLQKQLKQPVVVENRPGAGGNIGTDVVAKSPADGHTVLMVIDSTLTVNPHIYKGMPFKPADLRPVLVMASSGLLVGAHPVTGFKTLNDLVTAGRKESLNFSSAGSGSPGHLAAEVFKEAAGVKINHIGYKGNAPAVMAVLSGEVQAGVLATPGMLPHVKAGKINALAVTSRQRSPLAPDIPTVAEAGLKDLEQEVLYLAMVPAATPEPVVAALQRAFKEALAGAEVQARIASLDMHTEGLADAAAVARLADLSQRYARVIKATGMKVE